MNREKSAIEEPHPVVEAGIPPGEVRKKPGEVPFPHAGVRRTPVEAALPSREPMLLLVETTPGGVELGPGGGEAPAGRAEVRFGGAGAPAGRAEVSFGEQERQPGEQKRHSGEQERQPDEQKCDSEEQKMGILLVEVPHLLVEAAHLPVGVAF